ncbi:MAG: NUDIX domain-containing protein [Candidatus Micrarchaeota archaeon]
MKPEVGIGVFVHNASGEVLIHKRKNIIGNGTWALPGGKLEFNETIEQCAKREAKEECDVEIKNVKVLGITEDFFTVENRHFITIFVDSELASGEAKIMEPEKASELSWVSLDNLPSPLFLPLKNFAEGKRYPHG